MTLSPPLTFSPKFTFIFTFDGIIKSVLLPNQALELAFLISDEIKKNSSYSKNADRAAS